MAFVDVWDEFPFGSRQRQWPIRRPRQLDEEGRHISIIWPENEGALPELPAIKRQRVLSDNKLCEKCNNIYLNGSDVETRTNGHVADNDGESVKDNEFRVQLVTKSFLPDEVSVKISGRVLSIRAHHEERNKENGTYVYRALNRQYVLPEAVAADKVTSELTSDGVLTIRAPLSAKVKPTEERVVPVKVESGTETKATQNGEGEMEVEKEKVVKNEEKKIISPNMETKVVQTEEKKAEESETKEDVKKSGDAVAESNNKEAEEQEKMDETDKP